MFENVDEGHAQGEEKIVFRYNREERLKNAPQIVRDYYDGKNRPVRGFKVLWVNKSNRFILLSLVFFIAFVWIYTAINNTRNYANIDGTILELKAFSFQENIYTSVTISSKTADEKSNPVTVTCEFFFINNDNQVIEKKQFSTEYKYGESSLATKASDYDIIRVDVIASVGGKEKELSAAVKR